MRAADYKELRDHICRHLTTMMDDAPAWCGTGCEFRELPAEYFVEALERGERWERDERKRVPTLYAPDAPRSTNADAPDALRS